MMSAMVVIFCVGVGDRKQISFLLVLKIYVGTQYKGMTQKESNPQIFFDIALWNMCFRAGVENWRAGIDTHLERQY